MNKRDIYNGLTADRKYMEYLAKHNGPIRISHLEVTAAAAARL